MRVCIVYSDGDMLKAFPEDAQGREEATNVIDVSEALRNLGHDVTTINANDQLISNLMKAKNNIDIIFSIADEGYNLDPHLEPNVIGIFDLLGIPYTGGGLLSLGLCLDKPLAKQVLTSYGLPTPRYKVYHKPISNIKSIDLKFPLIVKPAKEDGSIGIRQDSVVEDVEHLKKKVNKVIKRYHQPAIVEEFIEGREVNIGIVGDKKLIVLPASEIIFELPEGVRNFMFYETKWAEESVYYQKTLPQCPADLSSQLKAELEELAKQAYRAVHLKGYGRVDFRVDKEGKPYILEVNPNPDICKDAGLARMARANGWTYEELIQRIMDIALNKE